MLNENFKLGLTPENGIAKIIRPTTKHPPLGNGVPRCEIYLIVENPEQSLENAVKEEAIEISKVSTRDWEDIVSYCSDLDGHIIAFAK